MAEDLKDCRWMKTLERELEEYENVDGVPVQASNFKNCMRCNKHGQYLNAQKEIVECPSYFPESKYLESLKAKKPVEGAA